MVGPDGRAWVGNFGFDHREGDDPRTTCAVRVADPPKREVLRVREGGEVTERIRVATQAIACMLGGPRRTTLFVCTAESLISDDCRAKRSAKIEVVEVSVPGAGLP